MPCLAQGKPIYSKLPSFERAIGLASIKTGYECRKILDGPYTKEEEVSFFRIVNVSNAELSGPVVNILYNEFKKYISDDCRSFDNEEVKNAAKRAAPQPPLGGQRWRHGPPRGRESRSGHLDWAHRAWGWARWRGRGVT